MPAAGRSGSPACSPPRPEGAFHARCRSPIFVLFVSFVVLRLPIGPVLLAFQSGQTDSTNKTTHQPPRDVVPRVAHPQKKQPTTGSVCSVCSVVKWSERSKSPGSRAQRSAPQRTENGSTRCLFWPPNNNGTGKLGTRSGRLTAVESPRQTDSGFSTAER